MQCEGPARAGLSSSLIPELPTAARPYPPGR